MSTDGFEVTIGQVLWWSVFIGAAAWIAFLVYRSMDHPRLVLTPTPEGLRATPRNVIQYAVSMPFLIALWWGFFFLVFLINENHVNLVQLFVFPSALVVSIRALAFISPVTARELGKVLPVALVAFVILDGKVRDLEEIGEILDESDLIQSDAWVIPFVLFCDYAFTAIWYWGWIRWLQPRLAARKVSAEASDGASGSDTAAGAESGDGSASAEEVAHDDGGVAVLPDADGADRSP